MKKAWTLLGLGVACATAHADTGVVSTAVSTPAPVFVSNGEPCPDPALIALTAARSTASCIDGKWREGGVLSNAVVPAANGILIAVSTFTAGNVNVQLPSWRRLDGHVCRQYAKGVSYAPDGSVTRIDTGTWCDDDKFQQSAQN